MLSLLTVPLNRAQPALATLPDGPSPAFPKQPPADSASSPAPLAYAGPVRSGASRLVVSPARKQSTLAALGLAVAAAIAGAVLWGLLAILLHRQLLVLSLLIGAGVGAAVARFRPGHWPSVVAGAVIAVAGCALGTLLAIVFSLLDAQISMSAIMTRANLVARAYPSAVGWLGLLFWLVAGYAAFRVPVRSARQDSAQIPGAVS